MKWQDPSKWLENVKTKHVVVMTLTIVLYAVAKAYVLYTPTPHDDMIPDRIRDGIIMLVDGDYVDSDDPLNSGKDPADA